MLPPKKSFLWNCSEWYCWHSGINVERKCTKCPCQLYTQGSYIQNTQENAAKPVLNLHLTCPQGSKGDACARSLHRSRLYNQIILLFTSLLLTWKTPSQSDHYGKAEPCGISSALIKCLYHLHTHGIGGTGGSDSATRQQRVCEPIALLHLCSSRQR